MRVATRSRIAGAGLALLGLVSAARAMAGGEKVAFPARYAEGVLYTTVDRADIKQYRELFVTPEAVDAVKAGKPIPSGTVFTLVQYKAKVDAAGNPTRSPEGRFEKGELVGFAVMEKRTGWGSEYAANIRNGEWEYQFFKPDRTVNEKADLKACFTCHKPFAGLDYVFSLISVKGAGRPGAAAR